MKAILPELDHKSHISIYMQLFTYIRDAILSGEIVPMEKLPSLRNLSEDLNISLTTASLAYSQLEMEGYIFSKPRSGYYVSEIYNPSEDIHPRETHDAPPPPINSENLDTLILGTPQQRFKERYDLSSFDFVKWKKCFSKVLNDYPQTLLFESDPQGEEALRYEIARYVFSSRGVKCAKEQIVIAAGTQQLSSLLALLLRRMGISHIAVEDPGYDPAISSFEDHNYAITKVPVAQDGIMIEKLPANIAAAAYVNPSNQFPTGAIMPISRRYQLLEWAAVNNSYVIEDDYDSELRYIGKPFPAMQGLDKNEKVIYLGSFSSTLFASVKISYMVMPQPVASIFQKIRSTYTQTCSKAEQLTLALFMDNGYYRTGIKKLRRMNSQKLEAVTKTLEGYAEVRARNTYSGINLMLNTSDEKTADRILRNASHLGLDVRPLGSCTLNFYYNQIPAGDIPELIEEMLEK